MPYFQLISFPQVPPWVLPCAEIAPISALALPEESLEQPCFRASSEPGDRSSSPDRCTQKMPLREHPRLHQRLPGGLPGVSRGPSRVRAAPRWLRRDCGRAPRGWRRDAPGGKAAFWSYLEAKQCWFIISIIILKKKSLIEHH